jgi:hypothetical protein
MFPLAVSPSTIGAQESSPSGFSNVFKRLGLARPAREGDRTGEPVKRDGYLLVLLADQEIAAGREDQARSLLDAAYSAFDEDVEVGAGGHYWLR